MAKSKAEAAVLEADETEIENPPDYEQIAAKAAGSNDEAEREVDEKTVRQTAQRRRESAINRRQSQIGHMSGSPASDPPPAESQEIVDPGAPQNKASSSPAGPGSPKDRSAPPAAITPAAPAAPAIGERVIAQAESWGIPREDAILYPNEAALTRVVDGIKRRYGAPANGATSPQTQHVSQPPPPVASPQPPAQPQTTLGGQPFRFAVPAAFLDPAQANEETIEFAKSVQGLHDHYGREFAALKQEIQQLRSAHDENTGTYKGFQQSAAMATLDTFVDGLGKDFHDVYGDGATEDMPVNSAELNARVDLVREYDALRQGYISRGERPPSDRKLLRRAHNAIHADTITQKTVSNISARARNAEGEFIARPSTGGRTNGRALDPEQQGIANMESRMRALNIGRYAHDERSFE